MPETDADSLGPDFGRRLRSELDRIRPRYSAPRYAAAPVRGAIGWGVAPVALVASLVAMVVLTAMVATGSTNPAVWTRQVVNTIHSAPSAAPTARPDDEREGPAAAPSHEPAHESSSEPSEQAEPTSRSEPSESPERQSPQRETPGRESPQPSGDH